MLHTSSSALNHAQSDEDTYLMDHPDSTEDIPILDRSEEHTSELQSPCNLVCRLLLEKKKFQSNRYPGVISTCSRVINPLENTAGCPNLIWQLIRATISLHLLTRGIRHYTTAKYAK